MASKKLTAKLAPAPTVELLQGQRQTFYDSVTGVKLPLELKQRALKEAQRHRRSISWVVRDALLQRYGLRESGNALVKVRQRVRQEPEDE